MSEAVGATLQRAREERGLSIIEVAQQLKFSPRQLEALEQERYGELPGGTFVRCMVRNYARLLRLDPRPLVERVGGHVNLPDAGTLAARYTQPVPFSDNGRRSTFVYLALSLGVLAIGGGVAYQWYRDHGAAAMMADGTPAPSAPAVASAKAEPKAAHAGEDTTVVKMSPAKQSAAAPTPPAHAPAPPPAPAPVAASEAKPATQRPAAAKRLPASVAAEKPAVAKVTTAPGGVHRLVIRCEEEAWIEVKDANDRMLVSSLNPAGAERVVRARGPLMLVIGNAAHVQVLHNDRPLDLAPHTKLSIARLTLE